MALFLFSDSLVFRPFKALRTSDRCTYAKSDLAKRGC